VLDFIKSKRNRDRMAQGGQQNTLPTSAISNTNVPDEGDFADSTSGRSSLTQAALATSMTGSPGASNQLRSSVNWSSLQNKQTINDSPVDQTDDDFVDKNTMPKDFIPDSDDIPTNQVQIADLTGLITTQPQVAKVINDTNNLRYSPVLLETTTRPKEIMEDLGRDAYMIGDFMRFDVHYGDEELINLIHTAPQIKYLDVSNCNGITDFSLIGNLTNLEHLDVSSCKLDSDTLSFIRNLPMLKVLNVSYTAIDDLSFLDHSHNLLVLNAKMTRIVDLNGIECCTKLHDLVLWGCTLLSDISVVSTFTELRVLDLDTCPLVKDIYPIANLHNLIYLNLNYDKIPDIGPISGLTNLEIFTMDFCPLMMTDADLENFTNLVNMKFLSLRNRSIRNLYAFRNMTKLIEFEASGNTIVDVSPLENLTDMYILNLVCNPSLVDLSPLRKMVKIARLYIGGLKVGTRIAIPLLVEDLSVLENFPELDSFICSCAKKLKDVSPMGFCVKLAYLELTDCFGVSDV